MRHSIFYILPLILLGCAPKKPDPKNDAHDGSAPVLIVGDEHISLNEFNRRVEGLPDFASSRLATIEQKRDHLAAVTQFEVLALHAAKSKLSRDPEVVSALKIALQNSKLQKRFELSSEEIDEEFKRRQKKIRFGLISEKIDCSIEKQLAELDQPKRLETMKTLPAIRSFSDRVEEQKWSTAQKALKALKVGGFKVWPNQTELCSAIILTKIENVAVDRLKVESDLLAEKKSEFRKSLEK